MPLKDLVVKEQEVSEELLEQILAGNAQLATDTKNVILTREGGQLTARAKILLILAAQHAWAFVSADEETDASLTVKQLEEQTGLPGNTLRPGLKALKDAHIIASPKQGSYKLPAHALHYALDEIERPKVDATGPRGTRRKM